MVNPLWQGLNTMAESGVDTEGYIETVLKTAGGSTMMQRIGASHPAGRAAPDNVTGGHSPPYSADEFRPP